MTKLEVNGVRDYYGLGDDITDDQIRRELNNSLGLTFVRIERARKDLSKAFRKCMPGLIKKLKI